MNLYHYTDFNAMRGIIIKGEIWLWSLRRMNDSQEMEYFIRELKSAVKKQIEPAFYKRAENLFSENLKDFNKLASYAACFSEYKDDAAQWSRYAKNGTGVYIAFDKDLLFKIGNAGHAPLYKVNYSANCDDLEIVDDIVGSVLHPEKYSAEKIHEIFNRLITNSPFFKHPSFSSEKEYRLVSLPYNQTEFLGKPQFYVEENNIKKYYILNLKSICQKLGIKYTELFTEICIGPQARVPKNVLEDYFYCSEYPELCEKIKVSDCPLKRF